MNAKLIKMFPLEKNHMQVLFTSTADISCVQMVDKISLRVSTYKRATLKIIIFVKRKAVQLNPHVPLLFL